MDGVGWGGWGGQKPGVAQKQEMSIRGKDEENKNRQMGKDNCIWEVKECRQLKGRISNSTHKTLQRPKYKFNNFRGTLSLIQHHLFVLKYLD